MISELDARRLEKGRRKQPTCRSTCWSRPLISEPWGIGMRKNETALIQKVNETSPVMEKSGEAAKIFDKWLGAGTTYNLKRDVQDRADQGLISQLKLFIMPGPRLFHTAA